MQSRTILEIRTPKRDGSLSRSNLTGFLRVPVGFTIPHATATLAIRSSEIASCDGVGAVGARVAGVADETKRPVNCVTGTPVGGSQYAGI